MLRMEDLIRLQSIFDDATTTATNKQNSVRRRTLAPDFEVAIYKDEAFQTCSRRNISASLRQLINDKPVHLKHHGWFVYDQAQLKTFKFLFEWKSHCPPVD